MIRLEDTRKDRRRRRRRRRRRIALGKRAKVAGGGDMEGERTG